MRWFEALHEGENNNKFLAVFEDGMIYVYFRDSRHNNETRGVKIKTQEHVTANEYTRDQIIKMMQDEVGNFNFDKLYARGTGDVRFYKGSTKPECILKEERTLNGHVDIVVNAYENRALNFIVAHYKFLSEDVNPNLILRFDVRQINDIITFRMSENKREHWIVAACNDGYLRVFNCGQK